MSNKKLGQFDYLSKCIIFVLGEKQIFESIEYYYSGIQYNFPNFNYI